jgi:hypothetical protein
MFLYCFSSIDEPNILNRNDLEGNAFRVMCYRNDKYLLASAMKFHLQPRREFFQLEPPASDLVPLLSSTTTEVDYVQTPASV